MKKNDKVLTKEEIKYDKKMKGIVKKVAIGCAVLVLIEIFVIAIMKSDFNRSNTFYDTYSGVSVVDDGYIMSGSSQFKNSKFNKWNSGYEMAKFVKTNKDFDIIFESSFKSDFNSLFNDVDDVSDGYVAVGYYQKTEEKAKNDLTEGLIVKYDLDGKFVWSKDYQVLGDTVFTSLEIVSNGIVVVGQSIYENMEVGNHPTGGGIIVKYDFDGNILWFNNYGGNKSGLFNDILKVSDGYIAVGKDAVNVGVVVKFSLDGKLLWSKNYKYTDKIGFTGVCLTNDNYLLVVGSKEDSTDIYDALVVKYDLNGNVVDEFILNETLNARFNKVVASSDGFIVNGYVFVVSMNTSTDDTAKSNQDAITVRYDNEGNVVRKVTYGDSKTDIFSGIIVDGEMIVNVGYSNSKLSGVKSNGKDYFSRVVVYDYELEKVKEK